MWNILQQWRYCEADERAVDEQTFQKLLRLEWKRAHYSQRRFVLILLEPGSPGALSVMATSTVLRALSKSTRKTDIVGWYKDESVIGAIFTELGATDDNTVQSALLTRVTKVLRSTLSHQQANQVRVSFQLFPNSTEAVETSNETIVAAGYRNGDVVRNARQPNSSGIEVLALKATNSSS